MARNEPPSAWRQSALQEAVELRRRLYDAVVRSVDPDAGDLAVFYAWGRWFAVWRDPGEDDGRLPVSRIWQVVRLSADPSSPDGVALHAV